MRRASLLTARKQPDARNLHAGNDQHALQSSTREENDDHLVNESSASSRVPRRHRRRTPIPTQIVSNGEYLPPSQSATQNKVEARINELADLNGKHVGLNRRQFLHTSCGMAGAFLAMNDIYGNVFQVAPAEAREPDDQARAEYGRKRAKQGAKALRYCLGKKRPIVFHGVQNGHRNWNEEKLRFIYDDQILE